MTLVESEKIETRNASGIILYAKHTVVKYQFDSYEGFG